MSQEWHIRKAIGNDINFITATFLNNYWNDGLLGKTTRKSIFYDNYKLVLDKLLLESNVLVACKSDEKDITFGYLIYDKGIAHYCFVKEVFRKSGIAKSLFTKAFGKDPVIQFTHETHYIRDMLFMRPQFTYNPFILFKK